VAPDTVLRVDALNKTYQIYGKPHHRLIQPLLRHRRNMYREFAALTNITFSARRGEAIGIVGLNGSGKSTLLQIIAGTLSPTSGEVVVTGRVAALLELGSGFDPQFTGRENIYLNAAVLGFSRADVAEKIELVTAFADIGDFIDQPVSTFSTGMVVRLAFSIATCFEPDILVVDEALAVGDIPFQAKCFARMRTMIDNGVTVLFVSHSLGAVRAFCSKAAYLKEGTLVAFGNVNDVTREYERACIRAQGIPVDVMPENAIQPKKGHAPPESTVDLEAFAGKIAKDLSKRGAEFVNRVAVERTGTGAIQIEAAAFYAMDGDPISVVGHDQSVTLAALIRARRDVDNDLHVGVRLKTLEGAERLVIRDSWFQDPVVLRTNDRAFVRMEFILPVSAGDYYVEIGLLLFPKGEKYENQRFNFAGAEIADLVERCAFVHVVPFSWHPIVAPVLAEARLNLLYLG
jgi:lipopolysaccharide transport system ATP-binding protein